VARELATRLGCGYIDVADLARREGLTLGYDEEAQAHLIDEEGVRERLRAVARGALYVVDTHVVSAVPPELVEVAIVLRLDPRELEFRLSSRGYPRRKVLENVQAEILDACLVEAVSLLGEGRVFEVDATGKSPEEVVAEVLRVIRERSGARPGSVDWLERLGDEALKYLSASA